MPFGKNKDKGTVKGLKKVNCPNRKCRNGLVCIVEPVDADDAGVWTKCSKCRGFGYILTDR